jgi:L-ascorbate metabolism protein UlaG (beta-lactamase superfamily)
MKTKRPSFNAQFVFRHGKSLLLGLGPCLVVTGIGGEGGPAGPDVVPTQEGELKIQPLNHASLLLEWKGKAIYNDPVGGAKVFEGLPAPDLILITDIHQDHFNQPTLTAIARPGTSLVAPPAVAQQLPADLRARTTVLANCQTQESFGIRIEAVPAYNLTADRQQYHPKGRGNGYLLTLGGKRVYLSGDTEDIPEMLALKAIDVAFVCMNLPYTMSVEQAARAVRAFKPKIVYPYHYRGSDLEQFKRLVGDDAGVELRLRDWYGGRK